MPRLNRKAVNILLTELQRRPDADPGKQAVVRDYLQQLAQQPGETITPEELRAKITYLFPDFSEFVLQQAATANAAPPPASAPASAPASPPASIPVVEVVAQASPSVVPAPSTADASLVPRRGNELAARPPAHQPVNPAVKQGAIAWRRWWWRLKWGAIALGSGCGLVALANLPAPMIRRPVAEHAPWLLTPSFMAMDHDYRRATTLVEQADQLVNQATSPQDLQLGGKLVKAAQRHLDRLPSWALGYYPYGYCSWAGCGWRFSFDEFETARKRVGRMEATLFQENNAQAQLAEIETGLNQLRQVLLGDVDPTQRVQALGQFRQQLDALQQVPSGTLAGRMARIKREGYERDWQTWSQQTSR